MSNKLLSFLILILIFGILIGGYLYLFVYYTGNIVLIGNQSDYNVSFYSDTIKRTISKTCEKNICEIKDLPPLELTYTISKEGFKDFVGKINIKKNDTIKTSFKLKRETILLEEKDENNEKDLTKTKIDEIRNLGKIKDSYSYFDLLDLGIFYFEENIDSLSLYNSNSKTITKIYDFDKISKNQLKISKIDSVSDEIFIEIGENKYIYNLKSSKIYNFSMKIGINYVKSINNSGDYQIVTEKGTFIFSSKDNKIDYFPMFFDFVYYDDNSYIGIIYSDENDKKKNYGLSSYDNIILYYNPVTKEKKVLLNTSLNITKLVWEQQNIYAYDENGKKYLLKVGE